MPQKTSIPAFYINLPAMTERNEKMRLALQRFVEPKSIHRVDAVTLNDEEYTRHAALSSAPANPKVVVITLSHRRAIQMAYAR
jgi:hypothetical protein